MIKFFLSSLLVLFNINEINGFSRTIPNIKQKIISKDNFQMSSNICPEYLNKFTSLLDEEKSEAIVKGTTSFLTKVDGVGGYILHTNDIIINFLLNNDLLSIDIKKKLILQLIEFSQAGDATGHQILQFYYDLVSCLL